MGRGFDDELTDKDLLQLLGLRERMNRLFDEQQLHLGSAATGPAMNWTPPVDIVDAGNKFILTAELPGVDEEAVDLELVGDSLILKGERPPHVTGTNSCYHRIERPEGPFRRTFTLPAGVDASAISAELKDGVLEVHLPKTPSEGDGAKEVDVEIER